MKALKITGMLFLLCLTGAGFSAFAQSKGKKYVVIGYVGGYKGLIDTSMVNASKLTHINYAFVDVQHNRAWLTHLKTDTTNFRYLVSLKKRNPDLKILISIGGWTWSGNFSDAVLTDTSRRAFAASAVEIVRKYNLDGVDIDWEYPGQKGLNNTHRDEDKQNYTMMFQALRQDLDVLEQETGKKKFLTTAVGGFKRYLQYTEMDKAAQYLDYINLMTYDYSDSLAVHHTNLYASKKYVSQHAADLAIADYVAAGVPISKMVMGLAFYGRSFRVDTGINEGLGRKKIETMRAGGYTFLKDSLTNQKGFKYYRDNDAKAPYLYNATTKQFITYDDDWSVTNKCDYVIKKGMAGAMFWEYTDDRKEYLLDRVDKILKVGR